MKNILEHLEASARICPHTVALSDRKRSLSYQQLYDQSRGIGSTLLRNNLTGKPVVVWMGIQARTVAACLGAVYSGCFFVIVREGTYLPQVKQILEQVHPCAILFDPAQKMPVRQLNFPGLCLSYEEAAFRIIDEAALETVRRYQKKTDPVCAVTQVDSTGNHKCITKSHQSLLLHMEQAGSSSSLFDFLSTSFSPNSQNARPFELGITCRQIAIPRRAPVCLHT